MIANTILLHKDNDKEGRQGQPVDPADKGRPSGGTRKFGKVRPLLFPVTLSGYSGMFWSESAFQEQVSRRSRYQEGSVRIMGSTVGAWLSLLGLLGLLLVGMGPRTASAKLGRREGFQTSRTQIPSEISLGSSGRAGGLSACPVLPAHWER